MGSRTSLFFLLFFSFSSMQQTSHNVICRKLSGSRIFFLKKKSNSISFSNEDLGKFKLTWDIYTIQININGQTKNTFLSHTDAISTFPNCFKLHKLTSHEKFNVSGHCLWQFETWKRHQSDTFYFSRSQLSLL